MSYDDDNDDDDDEDNYRESKKSKGKKSSPKSRGKSPQIGRKDNRSRMNQMVPWGASTGRKGKPKSLGIREKFEEMAKQSQSAYKDVYRRAKVVGLELGLGSVLGSGLELKFELMAKQSQLAYKGVYRRAKVR
jgi:hypothetical protein